MRLAVTSCADPLQQPVQDGWARVARAEPDHLLLLGDQMYMDYAFFPFTLFFPNPGNGRPARYSDLEFAGHMYARYARQWQALRRSGLWELPRLKVHGIWDDHDFAWNNSRGAGSDDPAQPAKQRPVPARKQRISRFLSRQFFDHLRADAYPPNELLTQQRIDDLGEDLSKPHYHSELEPVAPGSPLVQLADGVQLLLTDGRSYRTDPDDAAPTLLGEAQRRQVSEALAQGGITLVASGCTLNDKTPECWSRFPDYEWLRATVQQQAGRARVLFFSGDVHCTDIRDDHGPGLIEVVASGMARPWSGMPWRRTKGNHALCEIGSDALQIALYEGLGAGSETPRRRVRIDRASWGLQSA